MAIMGTHRISLISLLMLASASSEWWHRFLRGLILMFIIISYVTMVFMQYGNLLAIRNRRVSLLNSNPLWGPRRNLAVPIGMVATALIAVTNLYGPGLQRVFLTTPIPGMFWGPPF